MPRFLTWVVVRMLPFTETENIGKHVYKGGSKGSNVFTLGHISVKESMRDPRRVVGIWRSGSRLQKNGLG